MNTEVTTNFAVKPLVAAVALAISAVNAYAAPTINQMPGGGKVTAGSTDFGGPGSPIVGLTNTSLIGVAGKAVITWGGAGAPADGLNPGGFNIGSNGKLQFSAPIPGSAVLNIDASLNPSQIFGTLEATPVGYGFAPAIFVSNGNGIIVGGSGRIIAPNGVGLIGANLNNATAINDFIGNNGTGVSYLDVTDGQSVVNIAGGINGDPTLNIPASYILLVGGDITNTGNLFANQVNVAAGMRAIETQAAVNDLVIGGAIPVAAPLTRPVHRLWNVDSATSVVSGNVGTLCGVVPKPCSDNVEVATAASFVNEGSISAQFGWIGIEASDSIRSGIAGNPSLLLGMYADAGIVLDTFSDTGKTELYNVVTSYTADVNGRFPLPFLDINQQDHIKGKVGDVTIEANTRASQPSSIFTTDDVRIFGANVAIKSTINHEVKGTGKFPGGDDLTIIGTKSVSITKDVGSQNDVYIKSTGPLSITGNVNSDTDKGSNGYIRIYNDGPNAPTTISGNLKAWNCGFDCGAEEVRIEVDGPLTVSGAVTALGGGVYIRNHRKHAPTLISGNVFGGEGDVDVDVIGPLTISGNLTAGGRDCCFYYGFRYYDVNVTNRAISNDVGDATTISGNILAGRNAHIDVWGALSITGDVTAISPNIDAVKYFYADSGRVYIHNFGRASGNTTTITGNVYGYDYVDIRNYGQVNSHLNISGNVKTADGGLHVVSYGDLQLGQVDSGRWIDIGVYGLRSDLNGPVTANGDVFYQAPIAQTNLKPAAVITGDSVELQVRNFQGVNASGLPYTSAAQKPDAQIVTDFLELHAYGTVNAPIAGNANFLTNAMVVAPTVPGGGINAIVSAEGASFQAINLLFKGDFVNLNSGNSATPFELVGLTSGTFPAGALQGNVGSSLLLQAEHNMFVNGGNNPGGANGSFFQFPGGIVFKAGDSLTVFNPVYNAWTTTPAPFQGIFLEAPVINALSYFATNMNSWVNFSTLPTGALPGAPILSVYTIKQLPSLISFNFSIDPQAPHINSYSSEILGGPVNTCPIGFVC